jgi:hypothetical protein
MLLKATGPALGPGDSVGLCVELDDQGQPNGVVHVHHESVVGRRTEARLLPTHLSPSDESDGAGYTYNYIKIS